MALVHSQVPIRFRFSKERIAELLAELPKPGDGPTIGYDTEVKQLGLRIQPSGKAQYFVLKKVAGKTFRKTLGDYEHLPIGAARKHAHALLASVADWLAGDRQDVNPMRRPVDDGRLTFAVAFESYLKSPRKRVTNRKKADKRARYWFDKYLSGIQNREVSELTPTVIESLHQRISKDAGPVAANRCVELMRAVFNHLIAKELWSTLNPATIVESNSEEARARILQPDELKPFLDALQDEKNRDAAEFFDLLLATGARKSNLYSCEWRELSLSGKSWTIPAWKYKNGKTTTLPLKAQALQLFRARRERLPKDCRALPSCGCHPWVFPSNTSESGHIEDYKRQFDRIKKAAELQDFTTHDLRRSFIAFMVASGKASMPVISAAAGHSSPASMTPYARFAKGAVASALDAGTAEMEAQIAEAEKERKLLSA